MEDDQGFLKVSSTWMISRRALDYSSFLQHWAVITPSTLIDQRPLHPRHLFPSFPPRLRFTRRPCLRWASKSLPRTNLLSAIQPSRLPSLAFSTFYPQLRHPSINTGALNMLLFLPVSANPGSSLPIALPPMQPVTGTYLSALYRVHP